MYRILGEVFKFVKSDLSIISAAYRKPCCATWIRLPLLFIPTVMAYIGLQYGAHLMTFRQSCSSGETNVIVHLKQSKVGVSVSRVIMAYKNMQDPPYSICIFTIVLIYIG